MESRLSYSDKYRYQISFIDTQTDNADATRYAKNFEGVKRNIIRQLKEEGYEGGRYDNTDRLVIFIRDSQMFTALGEARLAEICRQHHDLALYITIDECEVLNERGIDFDIWHDNYLNEEERAEYDAIRTH